MAEQQEIIDIIIKVVKTIVFVVWIVFYWLFCEFRLIFDFILPPEKKSLDGETILITGSSTGIGREVVLQLAKNHPRTTLVLWDWNETENIKTANEARKLGAKIFHYQLDVADYTKVKETAERVQKEVGDVTILFNNAGIARIGSIIDLKPEDIEKTIQVNLISHFWTIKTFLPKMIEKNHGHIVTTASMGAFVANKYGAPYFAAKHGIRGYIESLQDELRADPRNPDKIKFTTIFPFFVRTPLTKGVVLKVGGVEDKNIWLSAPNVASTIIEGIQRNRDKVMIPKHYELLVLFKSLVPNAFFQYIGSISLQGDYKEEEE